MDLVGIVGVLLDDTQISGVMALKVHWFNLRMVWHLALLIQFLNVCVWRRQFAHIFGLCTKYLRWTTDIQNFLHFINVCDFLQRRHVDGINVTMQVYILSLLPEDVEGHPKDLPLYECQAFLIHIFDYRWTQLAETTSVVVYYSDEIHPTILH